VSNEIDVAAIERRTHPTQGFGWGTKYIVDIAEPSLYCGDRGLGNYRVEEISEPASSWAIELLIQEIPVTRIDDRK